MQLDEVRTDAQIEQMITLARGIWLDHFSPMLGRDTVEHLLENTHTLPVMRQRIEAGYRHFFIVEADNAEPAGYLSYLPQPDEDRMLLSKLYLRREMRGRGLGRQAVDHVVEQTRRAGLSKIVLYVYPGNTGSIAAYERMGFEHAGTIHRTIGEFEVDDVFMRKRV